MSTRDAFEPAPAQLNGTAPKSAAEPKKRSQSRKKKDDSDSALSRSAGHDLVEEHKAQTYTTLSNLDTAEEQLRAAKGFQKGQKIAAIEAAAELAGYSETRQSMQLSRLSDIVLELETNSKNFDPMEVLGGLGFLPDQNELNQTEAAIDNFLNFDFSSISH